MPPLWLGQRLCFGSLFLFLLCFPPLLSQLFQLFFRLLVLGDGDDFDDRFDQTHPSFACRYFSLPAFSDVETAKNAGL